MNIMFLANFPIQASRGGVERVTDVLAHEFLKRGHTVIYLSASKQDASNKQQMTIPHQYYIDTESHNIMQELNAITVKYRIEYVINQIPNDKTFKVLKNLNYDIKIISVFHIQPFHVDGITRKRIWQTNTHNYRQFLYKIAGLICPKIHEKYAEVFEKHNLINAYSLSSRVCFISDRFYPRVLRHLPDAPVDKFIAINNPNTFDVNQIELPNKRENIILYVGRVENAEKNTLDFIKMWKLLSENNPEWRAIVVGTGSDLEYNIRFAKSYNIKRIEFAGLRTDVAEFYKKAKFVAVTSYTESWCMVLTESMAYGCVPCVYNTYETLHDIVEDGMNGLIVEPNPQAMAECIQHYINNEKDFNRISVAAYCKAKQFSTEKIVDRWENSLGSL